MRGGIPVNRHLIVVLKDGTTAIDWGENQFLDVSGGKFIQCSERDISHPITNEELDQLKISGLVVQFDQKQVFFVRLPERNLRTLD
jgi:hypothetical protein